MSKMTGKTIYVLGAGASHHTGIPLLSDFLVTSRLLYEGKVKLQHADSFEEVFKWINSLRGSTYYVDFDLDNLEHIFSLAEMSRQLGLTEGEKLFSHLRFIVMETVDNTSKLLYQGKYFKPDPLYSKFSNLLKELNKQRKELLPYNKNFENDVIITFNYDIMLDHAMYFEKLNRNYCLDSKLPPGRNPFSILKLHGSVNWATCNNCENLPQIVEPKPYLFDGHNSPQDIKKGLEAPFNMGLKLTNITCDRCQSVLEPVVIPPTWSKTINNTPLGKVWDMAVKEIKKAFQIIIIGYSLPPTDTFFQYLMTLGLASNPNLHRVVVVNSDNTEDFQKGYEKLFSRSLRDRGRLKFLKGKTFREFVDSEMKKIGCFIEWKISD